MEHSPGWEAWSRPGWVRETSFWLLVLSGSEGLSPLASPLGPTFLSMGNEQPSTRLSESRGFHV